MRRPIYKYPDFVAGVELDKTDSKSFWLKLIIDASKQNPSLLYLKTLVNKEVSDKPFTMSRIKSTETNTNAMLLKA